MFIENLFKQPYLDAPDDLGGGNEPIEPVIPTEPTEPVEPTEVTPTEDEFEEIVYNKESVKIPKTDRQKYLQMGYHLEHKVQGKLTEYEKEIQRRDEFVKKLGYNSFEELEQVQAQRELEEQAEAVANQNPGMSQETAIRLIQLEKENAERKQQETIRTIQYTNMQEKESLKNDPLFKELDVLVGKTLGLNPTLSYAATYNYIAGTPEFRNRIIEESKKLAVKSTIANIHDNKSRGLTGSSDSDPEPEIELTSEGKSMAAAFGNDPREIAKYVKSKTKK